MLRKSSEVFSRTNSITFFLLVHRGDHIIEFRFHICHFLGNSREVGLVGLSRSQGLGFHLVLPSPLSILQLGQTLPPTEGQLVNVLDQPLVGLLALPQLVSQLLIADCQVHNPAGINGSCQI